MMQYLCVMIIIAIIQTYININIIIHYTIISTSNGRQCPNVAACSQLHFNWLKLAICRKLFCCFTRKRHCWRRRWRHWRHCLPNAAFLCVCFFLISCEPNMPHICVYIVCRRILSHKQTDKRMPIDTHSLVMTADAGAAAPMNTQKRQHRLWGSGTFSYFNFAFF